MRSSDPKPIHLLSLFKYIHFEYISMEDYNRICDIDINDVEQQLQVIRTVIIPQFNQEYDDEGRKRMKKVLEICIQESNSLGELFEMVGMPFDDEIKDKKAFLKNIYHELFGKEEEQVQNDK